MKTCPTCHGEGELKDEKVLAIERAHARAAARAALISRWVLRTSLIALCAISLPATLGVMFGILKFYAFIIHTPMYGGSSTNDINHYNPCNLECIQMAQSGEMHSGFAMMMAIGLLFGFVALASSIALTAANWSKK